MTKISVDIAISGAGLTGLVTALAFGQRGYSVVCVDPANIFHPAKEDRRTTAYLQPAKAFLEELGFWPDVQKHAEALYTMRIMDASSPEKDAVVRDFQSKDVSDAPFGWNIANAKMQAALVARLKKLPNVKLLENLGTTQVFTRTGEGRITLSDGQKICAKLIVSADGRNSPIRSALDVQSKRSEFGQSALAFSVSHPIPHRNISTEVHKTGGPFTLVPLPDENGSPRSGVVWMDDDAKIDRLLTLSPEEFAKSATERCDSILGPLEPVSQPARWPIISQIADSFFAERTAFIGEAAHVVPPIGAQGFNMSLADIACLTELAGQSSDPGDPKALENYDAQRRRDVVIRAGGIGILNRISQLDNSLFQEMRRIGLSALHGAKPVRQTLMKMGLGGSTPHNSG